MAIYEFKVTILPCKEFNKKFKLFLPLYLWEHGNGTELDIYCGYDTDYEYWTNDSFNKLENILKKEFSTQDKPWSEDFSYYGYEKSIRFMVWSNSEGKDISMRIDIRNIDNIFLKKILDILAKFNTIVVIEDTGKVSSSDYNIFIKTLYSSKRYKRFCLNSKES